MVSRLGTMPAVIKNVREPDYIVRGYILFPIKGIEWIRGNVVQ
jgi:hypothetical protein